MKRHLHLPPNNKTFHLHSKHQNQIPKPETEAQSWIQISIQAAAAISI